MSVDVSFDTTCNSPRWPTLDINLFTHLMLEERQYFFASKHPSKPLMFLQGHRSNIARDCAVCGFQILPLPNSETKVLGIEIPRYVQLFLTASTMNSTHTAFML